METSTDCAGNHDSDRQDGIGILAHPVNAPSGFDRLSHWGMGAHRRLKRGFSQTVCLFQTACASELVDFLLFWREKCM
jgi:hypothetical protein